VEPQPAPDAGSAPDRPTCYRHPERETYLSCVRCGKPACPECLREAPVGHQCVDCIKGGNQTVRQPTAAFGGRVVSGAMVTWALIGINVLLYLVQWAYPALVQNWAMLGAACTQVSGHTCIGPSGVAFGQYYRLLTSAFIPGNASLGILDILFNMWALLIVGPGLERVLGHLRFLVVYLASALGGAAMYYWLAPFNQPAVGASGAIFGLFAAWFVVARRIRADVRPIVILIVLNLVLSFVGYKIIAWQDHLGGLITGGLLTAAFAYAPRKYRTLVQVGAAILVAALLIIAVVARNHQLTSALGITG
jgi:membrane associated rhomboid family serine protease